MIVIGLGTVWILDGLEVTVVGNIASRLSEDGSGLAVTDAQVTGLGAALYVAGACSGALFFGWLTDRYGRKKLFLITLAVYLAATAMTALSFSAWWFFLFRFLTGFGIGGEYAAINSAIDELIPSKYRGRVDLIINGSYWLGAMGGALLSVLALNTDIFPKDLGWRLTFGLGVVLGLVILVVRRHVPESPRWMFIHGHEQGAEELVDDVERQVEEEKGEPLLYAGAAHHHRAARERGVRRDRQDALPLLSEARGARLRALHRAGLPLQRHHVRLQLDPGEVLRRLQRSDGLLLRRHRLRQLPRAAAARPVLRHRRAQGDDRRDVSALRRPALRHGLVLQPGVAERDHDDRVLVRGPVLRVGGGQFGVSDGERDLPDGDAGDGDRLLLRDRHGGRRYLGAAGLLGPDVERSGRRRRPGVLHRRGPDDGGGHGGRVLRGRRRGQGAGGHRHAAVGTGGDGRGEARDTGRPPLRGGPGAEVSSR